MSTPGAPATSKRCSARHPRAKTVAERKTNNPVALVGDIGGTNARFALLGARGIPTQLRILPCARYASLGDAMEAYVEQVKPKGKVTSAAIAVASPITGDKVKMTNRNWSFSTNALQRRLGLQELQIVNDFLAIALAVPGLKDRDRLKVGPGQPAKDAPIAVIGPGTGLGVSLLVPDEDYWLPVATEGGHVTLPSTGQEDDAILDLLRVRFGHVSAERVLSGPGLANLYDVISARAGKRAAGLSPAEITDRALAGRDKIATETLQRFCGFLGTVAGDLALTSGALGGIYIAGGIVPRFGKTLARSPFRPRFEAKGRFKGYLRKVPTYVVTAEQPALAGLAQLLNG
ncbi:MAG: glucokinase [Rhodospirillaceae bacterium]|jgi:glucokinase|nr:glucokinase [Rhodospirillaceae bacterium]MBT5456105.1 glucokinase [Rhodospirillaceae bacterium]